MFREHFLETGALPCLIVKSSSREKEESVRKKDISLSAEKESLKGSRKDRLLERARRKNDIQVSSIKNLHKVLEVESLFRRSQRVIPNPCLWGITSSSLKRTPVLAAGFQLEGNLRHFTKSCTSTRSIGPPPRAVGGSKERNCALALLGRYKQGSFQCRIESRTIEVQIPRGPSYIGHKILHRA